MVYFRMTPLGLVGGSQDTTTLLAEEGTALIPAGGPGTGERRGTGGDPGGEERLPRTGGPRPSPRKGPFRKHHVAAAGQTKHARGGAIQGSPTLWREGGPPAKRPSTCLLVCILKSEACTWAMDTPGK